MQFKSVQNVCHFTVHYCTQSVNVICIKKNIYTETVGRKKKNPAFSILSSRIIDVKKRTVRVRPQVRVEKSQLGSHLASGMRRL